MRGTTRTPFLPYAGAVVFTALAVLIRFLLDPLLGDTLPLVTLYGAVAAAVWFGGYGPALLVVALGYLACAYLFIEPRGAFGLSEARNLVRLVAYVVACASIIGFGKALHRAASRALANRALARRQGAQLLDEIDARTTAEADLVTTRKQAEEEAVRLNRELQHRVDELQTILDLLPIGVAIAHDPQCQRITHNPYMSALLNVPAWANASLTAPPGQRPTNFTIYRDGKEAPASELPMQLAASGVEVRDLELDLVCQGREPRTMLCYARPLFAEQGQVRGSVGACLDITSRKRAEEALRESETALRQSAAALRAKEAELELILSRTPLLLTRCSRDGRYVFVNRACAEFLGRPAEEIIGRPIAEVVGQAAFAEITPHIERVLRGEPVEFETEIPYAGVGRRFMRVQYTPDRDERGDVVGWVATLSDITEHKKMEGERGVRRGTGRRLEEAHRGSAAGRTGRSAAPGGRPPQGRVPRDPGPRAAQPPGADPQRPGNPAAGSRPASRGPGPRDDGTAARPNGPVDRRPSGRFPHHPRQVAAPQGARRVGVGRAGRRGRLPPAHRILRPGAPGGPAAGAALR
jgi:PAS domain S-box-containing protein